MKKFTAIILTLSIAACLTACDNNKNPNNSSDNSTSDFSNNSATGNSDNLESSTFSGNSTTYEDFSNSSSNSSDTSSEPKLQGSEITSQFELPFDESVDLTNAVAIGHDLEEIPLSEITEDNWAAVVCDYIYLAEPLGIFYNSVDNAGIFNEDKLLFEGVSKDVIHEFKKYRDGDKFGQLTVRDPRTEFSAELKGSSPNYYDGVSLWLEGQLVLTGWLRVVPETEGYILARDIQFIPDTESCKLPIIDYDEKLSLGMDNNFWWLSEYFAPIQLGNADEYTNLDLSKIPGDGSFVKVKITIDNIFCRSMINAISNYSARIVDLEIV